MSYPATELEYWSAFFSINDNQDKPHQQSLKEKQKNVTVEESQTSLLRIFGNGK